MRFDVVFVGGGLSAALGALALLAENPSARVAVVERDSELGRAHTWCFHAADVTGSARSWLEPLVTHRWPGYEVKFPRRERRLASPYACVTGAQLHRVVSERLARAPHAELLLGESVAALRDDAVELSDGRVLQAALVIDARGPERCPAQRERGFQKFLGLELEVEAGHRFREPVLMDAQLPQRDGLRFMYVLPFGADRLLLEDTYFSDTPTLHEAEYERDILAYAAAHGVKVRGVVRRETGVLPMPWRGELPSVPEYGPVRAGYAGGYFHPVTGYSFPIAVRFAEALAETCRRGFDRAPLRSFAERHGAQLGYLFTLTRTMFGWFEPAQRYAVLEHFYRLPEALIERFYAATLSPLDRARIFVGAPPRGLSLRRMFIDRVEALS